MRVSSKELPLTASNSTSSATIMSISSKDSKSTCLALRFKSKILGYVGRIKKIGGIMSIIPYWWVLSRTSFRGMPIRGIWRSITSLKEIVIRNYLLLTMRARFSGNSHWPSRRKTWSWRPAWSTSMSATSRSKMHWRRRKITRNIHLETMETTKCSQQRSLLWATWHKGTYFGSSQTTMEV